MDSMIPALVIGFREGLEAFLVVAVALRFLEHGGRKAEQRFVWAGAAGGVLTSALFGGLLFFIAGTGERLELVATGWESAASTVALLLVSGFIVWMIRHGSELKGAVESEVSARTGGAGIGLLALVLVLREGVEISLFSFAGTYRIEGIAAGLLAALILVALVFASLVRVNLAAIFNLTLAYLVLQAGFLLGNGIHEGLSALRDGGILDPASPLLVKAFNLTGTVLDHKQGALGLPLYVLAGWHSRPEWLQFATQYLYTMVMLGYWLATARRRDRMSLALGVSPVF